MVDSAGWLRELILILVAAHSRAVSVVAAAARALAIVSREPRSWSLGRGYHFSSVLPDGWRQDGLLV
jgi:hypothetical protein